MPAVKDPVPSLYEADFHAWVEQQADAIRRRDWRALDVDNLVEEVESMGKQLRSELVNRLAVLLAHLAKWQVQTTMRLLHGRSWQLTIVEQRNKLADHMEDNPSLKPYVPQAMQRAWRDARVVAARESGLSRESFPAQCPFTWDDAMREDWLPD